MTPIPVVCDDCHGLWMTESLFAVEGSGVSDVTFQNVGVSPCPYCSGTGHIPAGIYELRSNTSRYLGGLTADELRSLLHVIRDRSSTHSTPMS